MRAISVFVSLAAACALSACRSAPTLEYVDDPAADAGTDATTDGDSAVLNHDEAGALADALQDDDAFVFDDASDDGPVATGLCPSSNPPAGLTCCNAVPCIGARCAAPARCAQCERKCGTGTFCCADSNPPKCAAHPKGCLN